MEELQTSEINKSSDTQYNRLMYMLVDLWLVA